MMKKMQRLVFVCLFALYGSAGCLPHSDPHQLPGSGRRAPLLRSLSDDPSAFPMAYYEQGPSAPGKLSRETVEAAKKSVYMIEVLYYYRGMLIAVSRGSGFFISESRLITNFHVIGRLLIDPGIELSLKIQKHDFGKTPIQRSKAIEARLKKVSALYDLALLESREPVRDYLKIGDSLNDLQNLFTLGFPGSSFAVMELENPRLKGKYTLMTDTKRNYDGAVFQGLSGGPVVNGRGLAVGVNFAGRERSGKDWLSVNLGALRNFIQRGGDDALKCQSSLTGCVYSELAFFCRHFQSRQNRDFKIDFTYANYCSADGEIKKPPQKCAAVFERLDRAILAVAVAAERAETAIEDYIRPEKGGAAGDGPGSSYLQEGGAGGPFAGSAAAKIGAAEAAIEYERAYADYMRSVREWFDSQCRLAY